MDSENQNPASPEPQPQSPADPLVALSPAPDSPPNPGEPAQNTSIRDSSLSTWRHNGKIARLPKALRDKINTLIQDGYCYPDIIEKVGEAAKDLNPMNLSRWKDSGYKDWVLQQTWLNHTRQRQEPASALCTDFDATELNHAALQLGTLHIFEALRDLHPALENSAAALSTPEDKDQKADAVPAIENQNSKIQNLARPRSQLDFRLGGDSSAFVRLVNALARASRETMLVQKYRETCTRARAAMQPLKDPNRKLTHEETQAIVHKLDQILGFA